MNPTIQKIIAEAQKLIKQRNRKGARQILQQAVQHYPHEAHLWYWLGQTLDDRKQASYAFERALMYDPSLHQAQQFLDRIKGSTPSSPPAPQPSRPSRQAPPDLPAKKAPSPPPAPPPPQKKEKEADPEMSLDWLMNRTAPSAAMPEPQKLKPQKPKAEPPQPKESVSSPPPPPPPAPPSQENEGSSWSFLEELSEDDFYIEPEAENIRNEVSQPASSDGSFLEELQDEKSQSLTSIVASPWDFLTDDVLSNIEGTDLAAPPLNTAETTIRNAHGISEQQLWQRAQAFIGDVKLPESLSPEHQAARRAKMERGAFSFSNAPPSLAAPLAVRSDLPPLTEAQIKAALGVDLAEKKAARQEKSPTEPKRRRSGRLLGCLVLPLLLLVLLGSASWYLLKGTFYPTSLEEVKEINPELISTQVAELQVRYLTTAATPIPAPDWVAEAQGLRYQNNFTGAEERLRAGLEAEAGNSIGLATLSDLLRERPGREGEALSRAQEASDAATTVEERIRASESYVWALAHQAQPDVGQALARAEQAVEETAQSPHAFWALAMARALAGNADGSREALLSANALSEEVQPGALAAQEAEVYTRMGELEQAVALYEAALNGTDYIPWRVELVKIKRQLEHPDLEFHLNYLREIAPDDPAVQQLGQ